MTWIDLVEEGDVITFVYDGEKYQGFVTMALRYYLEVTAAVGTDGAELERAVIPRRQVITIDRKVDHEVG